MSNFDIRRNKAERYYFDGFSREEVNKFYDWMEICYDCIFVDRINPKTNLPYLSTHEPYDNEPIICPTTYVPYYINAQINITPPQPHKYEFKVKSEQLPCPFIHIYLGPSEYDSVQVTYHPFTEDRVDLQDWHLVNYCSAFNPSAVDPEYANDLFKIWMNVPKFRLRKADIYQEYMQNERLYLEGMQNIENFRLKIQALSLGYHVNLRPKSWVGEVLSIPEITEFIGQREEEEMKRKLMRSVLRN